MDDRIGQQLARLPTLESVHLNDQPPLADISDSGLKEMTKLCALKTLQLRGNCAVTAAGLAQTLNDIVLCVLGACTLSLAKFKFF